MSLTFTQAFRVRRTNSRVTATAGSSSSSLVVAEPSLTRRMFDAVDVRVSGSSQAGGAGGRTTYQALLAADQAWYNMRNMQVQLSSVLATGTSLLMSSEGSAVWVECCCV